MGVGLGKGRGGGGKEGRCERAKRGMALLEGEKEGCEKDLTPTKICAQRRARVRSSHVKPRHEKAHAPLLYKRSNNFFSFITSAAKSIINSALGGISSVKNPSERGKGSQPMPPHITTH